MGEGRAQLRVGLGKGMKARNRPHTDQSPGQELQSPHTKETNSTEKANLGCGDALKEHP